jgi:hypothetical protein
MVAKRHREPSVPTPGAVNPPHTALYRSTAIGPDGSPGQASLARRPWRARLSESAWSADSRSASGLRDPLNRERRCQTDQPGSADLKPH